MIDVEAVADLLKQSMVPYGKRDTPLYTALTYLLAPTIRILDVKMTKDEVEQIVKLAGIPFDKEQFECDYKFITEAWDDD